MRSPGGGKEVVVVVVLPSFSGMSRLEALVLDCKMRG